MTVGATYLSAAPLRRILLGELTARQTTICELSDTLGVPRRTVHRALASRFLRWDSADRLAVALGLHPSELWPEWFATSEVDQPTDTSAGTPTHEKSLNR